MLSSYGDGMDTETETAVAGRPTPTVVDLRRWLLARLSQRAEFLARASAWAQGRGDLVLTWPQDQPAVLALGVPCDDCVTLVYDLEPGAGRDRHVLQVTGTDGAHWARGIVARCGRAPVVGA